MTRVDRALSELVESVKEGLQGAANELEATAAILADLGESMGPVEGAVARAARSTAHSCKLNAQDLRKAAKDYESKMLPGDTPVVPLVIVKEASA